MFRKISYSFLNKIIKTNHPILCKYSKKNYKKSFIDEYTESTLVKLSSSPKRLINWDEENLNLTTNSSTGKKPITTWPLLLLSKLNSLTDRVPGLHENTMTLIDWLRRNRTKGSLKNFELILTVSEIVSLVHQAGDHEKAYSLFGKLRQAHGDIFDSITCSLLIGAISKTSKWKDCLELLKLLSPLQETVNTKYYTPVLVAAFRDDDIKTVCTLLDELNSIDQMPMKEFFEEILKHRKSEFLFEIIEKYNWILDEESVGIIREYFAVRSTVTEVKISDCKCPKCGTKLSAGLPLSAEEMNTLRKTFDEKVFIKNEDVFQTSNPEEIERFEEFIKSRVKYDLVIDALNVFYLLNSLKWLKNKDLMLTQLIKFFMKTYPEQNILIITRQHMKRQLNKATQICRPKHKVDWFYIENQSQDDLFSMYACLHGNDNCLLVTKDQLRDHRYLLGRECSKIFQRWQAKHQVVFLGVNGDLKGDGGDVDKLFLFQMPSKIETKLHRTLGRATKNGSVVTKWLTMHIPFTKKESNVYKFNQINWLCVNERIPDEIRTT